MTLTLDTLDDRRELVTLLAKLPPGDRVRFLSAACATAKKPHSPKPVYRRATVEAAYRHDHDDHRLTNAVYFDLLTLGMQWGVDLVDVAKRLESVVRRAKH